jgi:hypothetical protein
MASPLIEAFLRRTQTGVGKINARGSAIGSALQPFAAQAQANYAPAISQESALGGSLNQQQVATGQQLGGQIGSSLTSAQAPAQAVSQFGGGTATTGQQAGAAVGALSSADLERLRSTASAEQIYASALPRLAALAADQERRGFLADAQDDLMQLAAQEAEQNYARAQDEREWKRQQRQDRIEIQRYQRDQRQRARDSRIERARNARNDKLAREAAAKEYGLDVYNTTADNSRAEATAAETARHNRETEAAARAREARQAAKDKAGKTGKGGVDYKDIVSSAKDVVKPTENPNTGQVTPVSKADARRRLRAEFPGATAKQIEQALVAAGY